jgi:hypothetical protein
MVSFLFSGCRVENELANRQANISTPPLNRDQNSRFYKNNLRITIKYNPKYDLANYIDFLYPKQPKSAAQLERTFSYRWLSPSKPAAYLVVDSLISGLNRIL